MVYNVSRMPQSRSRSLRRRRLAFGLPGSALAAVLAMVSMVAAGVAGGAVGGIGAFIAAVAGSVWGASIVLAIGGDS